MPQMFFLTSIAYGSCALLRVWLIYQENRTIDRWLGMAEKLALVVFTGAMVFYVGELHLVDGALRSTLYDRPVSFLLLAWALAVASLGAEIAYGVRGSALFVNLWCAISLSLGERAFHLFEGLFNRDLEWLSFHRLCFMVGYAFCLLSLPWLLRYFWLGLSSKEADKKNAGQSLADRMSFRMILWALPLLTVGIIVEALLLMETNQLPPPEALWKTQRETFLAIAAWSLCGIYLHLRLFWNWKEWRPAALYLGGFCLLALGHLYWT
jgi:ABC-type transport system involved in cytochrome c biogenesis permease subunit